MRKVLQIAWCLLGRRHRSARSITSTQRKQAELRVYSRPSPPWQSCPTRPQRTRSRVPMTHRFRHSAPWLFSVSRCLGRLDVVAPFHHLSEDINCPLRTGPNTASNTPKRRPRPHHWARASCACSSFTSRSCNFRWSFAISTTSISIRSRNWSHFSSSVIFSQNLSISLLPAAIAAIAEEHCGASVMNSLRPLFAVWLRFSTQHRQAAYWQTRQAANTIPRLTVPSNNTAHWVRR